MNAGECERWETACYRRTLEVYRSPTKSKKSEIRSFLCVRKMNDERVSPCWQPVFHPYSLLEANILLCAHTIRVDLS